MLCIAQQKRSIGVNVVREGSPSRMRRVLLISLGMVLLPKSSTLLTMPVAFIVLQCGTAHRPFPTIIFQFAPLIVSSRTPRHSRGLLFTAKKRFRTYAKPLFAVKLSIGILSALFNHQSASDRMAQALVAGSSKFFFQHKDILL